jgi:hypothetical protein
MVIPSRLHINSVGNSYSKFFSSFFEMFIIKPSIIYEKLNFWSGDCFMLPLRTCIDFDG